MFLAYLDPADWASRPLTQLRHASTLLIFRSQMILLLIDQHFCQRSIARFLVQEHADVVDKLTGPSSNLDAISEGPEDQKLLEHK
jgi:hypothetical protein